MAGRIAAVRQQPVFNLIRERTGFKTGLLTLVAANLVSLLTCAAEIGAIAMLWQLMSGWPYRPLILVALAFFLLVAWFFTFSRDRAGLWPARPADGGVPRARRRMGPDWRRSSQGSCRRCPALSPARSRAVRVLRGRDDQLRDVAVRDLFLCIRCDRGQVDALGPPAQSRHRDPRVQPRWHAFGKPGRGRQAGPRHFNSRPPFPVRPRSPRRRCSEKRGCSWRWPGCFSPSPEPRSKMR